MSEQIVNKTSTFDKIIDEKFFSTPDMGEYWDTVKYKKEANKKSDKEGKTQFFVENPPTEEPGYHDDLGVVCLRANPSQIHENYMTGKHYDNNIYDGDTIKLSLKELQDSSTSFNVHYSKDTYSSVKDYLRKTLKLTNSRDQFALRFVGLDCPEVVHYSYYLGKISELDIYTTTYESIANSNGVVSLKQSNRYKNVNKSKVIIKGYNINEDTKELESRKDSEIIKLLELEEEDGIVYREIVDSDMTEEELDDATITPLSNRKMYKCVVSAKNAGGELAYHKASLKARDIVKESFDKATDCIMLLDTCAVNATKSDIPREYLKSFERSTYNPFYSIYYLWKDFASDDKVPYRYAGYRFPGQEANGRFLAAIYLQIDGQWINLNKKVLYEVDEAIVPSYTDSVQAMVNGYYLAKGFKMWTYDKTSQLYIDDVSEETYKSKDDRNKIQTALTGVDLKELRGHTMMIGDTLLMIPPTSIRVVSQSRTAKQHLLRAKGGMARTLPKTERLIQFEAFFNGAEAINGIPYVQKLPNGEDVTYYMNGLRGLIAQFKLSPFLPIHNEYINDTLNIQAVALTNYTISTVPDFPRTLQVSITMQEFDWLQYMPCQAMPINDSEEDLFRNGFSDTMHFPLLRYYYQRTLQNGQKLIDLGLTNPTSEEYIKATLGAKTTLQPINFSSNKIDLYIPDQKVLDTRKQAVIEMKVRPLGIKFNFSDIQSEWIYKARYLNEFMNHVYETLKLYWIPITDVLEDGQKPYLDASFVDVNGKFSYDAIVNDRAPMIYYENVNSGKKTSTMDTVNKHFKPAHKKIQSIYENNSSFINQLVSGFDIKIEFNEKSLLSKTRSWNLVFELELNTMFFETENDLDTIRKFVAKQQGLTIAEIFKDNKIRLVYETEFLGKELEKPIAFSGSANTDFTVLSYLSSLTDDMDLGEFDANEIIEDIKNSIDIEDANSIKFDKYFIGNPTVTALTTSYNNVFANVGLKAIDGHASQYTGGTDATLEVAMIGDETVVRQLYFLNRLCANNLINYRKIMRSSPLRIDSELTRLVGIYEVIIDAIDVNTVPNMPGLFNITLNLSSVDRTLRNREALQRIKGINNAETDHNLKARVKNYFDLNKALGQAELYPDLELPTCEELEKKGYYFMKNKFQPERVFVDPDFYFLYWYPTFSNLLKTSLTEFFENPENIKFEISDDMFGESFGLDVKFKDNRGDVIYTVNEEDWENRNSEYEKRKDGLKKLSSDLSEDEQVTLDEEDENSVKDMKTRKLNKLNMMQNSFSKLSEVLDASSFRTSQVNTYTQVAVKDYNSTLAAQSPKIEDIRKEVISKLKYLIQEELKKDIPKSDDWDSLTLGDIAGNDEKVYQSVFYPGRKQVPRIKKFVDKMCEQIFDGDIKMGKHGRYISEIVKAVACGALGRDLVSSSTKSQLMKTDFGDTEESNCYPPAFVKVMNKDGKFEKVPLCLYPDPKTSEMSQANEEEEQHLNEAVIFGRFGVKVYDGKVIDQIVSRYGMRSGFLDPMFNADIYRYIYSEEYPYNLRKKDLEHRTALLKSTEYGAVSTFREMLVWLYTLLSKDIFITSSFANAMMLMEVQGAGKMNEDKMLKELTESLFDKEEDKYKTPGAIDSICNTFDGWRYEDEFNQLIGENAYENMNDAIDNQEERIKNLLKMIRENSEDYVRSLVVGMFYSVGAITMSGSESYVLKAILDGDISNYDSLISAGLAAFDYTGLNEEQKRIARYTQYLNYTFDENERLIVNPLGSSAYNDKARRAYLEAANDPKSYLLHSFYDMVTNDKRGSMARAFPTYFMLLIDEGRKIGLWKLQDNFFDMNSLVEFEVVKSRKIAADTARIVMTNMYGTFNTEDVDMKDEYDYSLKDLWDSVFSPRPYFQKEYARRLNAREVNSAKMEPGARVHLRMGYSSNAATLPILFNGCVAEFEAGETMTLVCQGDGVEISNPHMFNAMDNKDVQDLKYKDKLIGYKQIRETFDNLSTPRDLLVNPLSAEGSFVEELIRKYSNGRFFNANPFGISHFGDRRFNHIFPTNGEVEQNIYEALSRPNWNYKAAGIETPADAIEEDYKLSEAPRVVVNFKRGLCYWDLMHIASGLSPDFITAIAPFQMRSTVFHGHPRFYYAYDYEKIDGSIIEKRKPYQQYHIYTSYTDIIDNRITTSQKDIRTNAIGYYKGPDLLFKGDRVCGPLFADIDIFPENQKSTSISLDYECSNTNSPWNIPLLSKAIDMFEFGDGPNAEKTAWRSTASALKDCMKEMYKGELIVMGDPSVKPYDRVCISDVYEDMNGNFEVEQVVHMFNTETGFTSSITPDLISAIDNKYETAYASIIANNIMPVILGSGLTIKANLYFHTLNRPVYLGIVRGAKIADNLAVEALNSGLTAIGKDAIQRDAHIINSSIKSQFIKDALGITDTHLKVADAMRLFDNAFAGLGNIGEVKSAKDYIRALDNLLEYQDIIEAYNDTNINKLKDLLLDPEYEKYFSADELDELKLLFEKDMKDSLNVLTKNKVISGDDIKIITDALDDIGSDEAKNIAKAIRANNTIDFATDDGRKILSSLKNIQDADFDKLKPIAKVLATKSDDIANVSKTVSKVSTLAKKISGAAAKFAGFGSLVSSVSMLALEVCLSKGAQNYLTNRLRNLQVLTMYPLKKDGMVWTAGIMGHQGSVFGSPTYNEPGWLENLAIKFFDYGNDSPFLSGAGMLSFLRDAFITTPEMKDIVNGYRRGMGFSDPNVSPDKIQTEAQNNLLGTIANQQMSIYSKHKEIFKQERISQKEIKDKTEDVSRTYAYYKIKDIRDIEQTSKISEELKYIFEDSAFLKKLYDKKCFKNSFDYYANGGKAETENVILEKRKIKAAGNKANDVYVKRIKNTVPAEYDIPYLRYDALVVMEQILTKVVKTMEAKYQDEDCEFEFLKSHPIIFHNGTRVNGNHGWASTGFLFTFEVKNYSNLSNIIKEVEEARDRLSGKDKPPYIISPCKEFGDNAYSVFVFCPKR